MLIVYPRIHSTIPIRPKFFIICLYMNAKMPIWAIFIVIPIFQFDFRFNYIFTFYYKYFFFKNLYLYIIYFLNTLNY